MKRLHVHVSVDDLSQSIQFCNTLFAAEPAVIKTDYAKWMLDDPRASTACCALNPPPSSDTSRCAEGIQA